MSAVVLRPLPRVCGGHGSLFILAAARPRAQVSVSASP